MVKLRWVVVRVRMCFQREMKVPPMTGRDATRRETLASIAAHHVRLRLEGCGLGDVRVHVALFEEFSGGHEGDAND
jgi:hypothetical protein